MANLNKVVLPRDAADADALIEISKSQAEAIDRGYESYGRLLDELMRVSGDPAMFNELETLLDQSNFEIESKIRKNKLNAIYLRVISQPARINMASNLSKMLGILIRMDSLTLTSGKSNAAVDRVNDCLAKIEQKVRKDLDSFSRPVGAEE